MKITKYYINKKYPFDIKNIHEPKASIIKPHYVWNYDCIGQSAIKAEVESAKRMIKYLVDEGIKSRNYINTYIDMIEALEDEFPEEFI